MSAEDLRNIKTPKVQIIQKKRLPVKLLYVEEYKHVAEAYKREKQVQGWNRRKKAALINGDLCLLPSLAAAYRDVTKFEISSEID